MTEFRARLRPKPGSIMADGSITLAPGQTGHPGAPIWIERRRLAAAERFGWRPRLDLPVRAADADLVSVTPPRWLGNPSTAFPPGSLLSDGSVVDYLGFACAFQAFVPTNLTPEQLGRLGGAGWCLTPAKDWPSVMPRAATTHITRLPQ